MAVITSLPQELIEHIIDLSDFPDTKHLKVLSTVSTAWRTRSQYQIFKSYTLNGIEDMKKIHSKVSECAGIPAPQILTLFSSVRCLHLNGGIHLERHKVYLKILRLFTEITELRIHSWDFRPFEGSEIKTYFKHFGRTVTALEIRDCVDNSEVLIFMKSLFPRVDDLKIKTQFDDGITKSFKIKGLPREVIFQGRLTFELLDIRYNRFLAFVSRNCSGVHSVTLKMCQCVAGMQELLGPRFKASELTSVYVETYSKLIYFCLIHCISHNHAPQTSSPSHSALNSEP